jgi:radical SAM protein with 4Fe4S-binding SPASM domain
MKADLFLKALQELQQGQQFRIFVAITGGEPLMRSDLEEIGDALKQRGHNWGFVTNGVLLTEARLASLLDSGLKSLSISLDGLQPAHEWLRGEICRFDQVMASIARAARAPLAASDVITCVTKHSLPDLPALKHLLVEAGVKRWRLITVFPKGRAKLEPDLFLDQQEFHRLMHFIEHERREQTLEVTYGCDGFLGSYERKVRRGAYFCRAGIDVMALRVDGGLSGCVSMREGFDQGNLFQHSIREIWDTRYQLFRDREWLRRGLCSQCIHFEQCQGNSLHLRDGFDDQNVTCFVAQYNLTDEYISNE